MSIRLARARLGLTILLFGFCSFEQLFAGLNTWTTGGPQAGRVEQIVVDPLNPARIYVLIPYGGVFKTLNGGVTWKQANRGNSSISALQLAIDPRAPTTLYVAAQNKGVFKSVDSAESWQPASVGLSGVVVWSVAVDPIESQRVYAATQNGVYKSANGGASWSPANGGLDASTDAVAIDPTVPTTLYAAAVTGLFKSTDAGATWLPSGSGLTSRVRVIQVNAQLTSTLYVGTESAGVFKSVDSGQSWNPAGNGLTGDGFIDDIAIDPRNGDRLLAAQRNLVGEAIFLTTNGGLKWTKMEVGVAGLGSAVAFHPLSSNTLYAGVNLSAFRGSFLISGNGGQTWTESSLGLSGSLITAVATDPFAPGSVYASAFARVFKSADRGASWSLVSTLPSGVTAFALDPAHQGIVYAATRVGVFKSIDGAANWAATNSGLLNLQVHALAIDRRGKTLYAGTDEGVFRSTNAAASWSPTAELPDPLQIAWILAVDPAHPRTVYSRSGNEIAKSTDGGDHWTRLTGSPRYASTIAIDPSQTKVLYVAADSGAFKSVDGGDTWVPVNHGLPDQLFFGNYLAMDPRNPATLYFSPFAGAFRTTDGAQLWTQLSNGDLAWGFQTFGLAVSADSKTVYAATYGGVYSYTIASAAFHTVQPCRLLDTRESVDAPALNPDSERNFVLSGKCGIPPTARSVALNLAVTAPAAGGHLTVYETGTPTPDTYSISFSAGRTKANNAIVSLDPLGRVTVKCTQESGTVHFIADVTGYFE